MKNKWVKWAAGLLAGSLLITPLPHADAEAAAQKTPLLSINGAAAQSGELEIRAGRAFMTAKAAQELLGFQVDYDSAAQSITLLRPDTKLSMKLGSTEAEIDGRRIKVETAAFAEKGQVYVPIRVLASALKTKSGWEAESEIVTLQDSRRYRMDSAGGQTVWVSFAAGDVYSLEDGKPKLLQGADVSELDWGTVDVRALGDRAYLLSVGREYGASMQTIHNRFQFLVQKGTVTKQAHYRYSGLYTTNEFGPQNLPAQRTYLSDGRTVQVVGAGGKETALYDLEEMTGQAGPFIVESVTADYLLVRAFDTLQPTVIDLKTGAAVLLYKELPFEAEVRAWDTVTSDTGELLLLQSRLRFTEWKGDKLIFTYKRIAPGKDFGREEKWIYALNKV